MPRFAELQQPQSAKETATSPARATRARRTNPQERQSPAAGVSNQRMQRKLRAAAKQQKTKEEQPPGPDEKAEAIAELLRNDAEDQSGVARGKLEALPAEERADVEGRVQEKLSEGDRARAAETLASPPPLTIEPTPAPEKPEAEAKAKEADEELLEEAPPEEEREEEEPAAEERPKKKDRRTAGTRERTAKTEAPEKTAAEAKTEGVTPQPEGLTPQPEGKTEAKTEGLTPSVPSDTAAPAAPSTEAAPAAEPATAGAAAKTGEAPAPAEGGAPSGPAQETAEKALDEMGAPAESKAAVSAGGGAAAAKAPAPTPAPAGGGGGGGGGGDVAMVEEGPAEDSPEAEEAEEKMAGAEREEEEEPVSEPEPQADEMSPEKALEESQNAPDSELAEKEKASEEQEKLEQAGGEPATEEDEAEENAAPAASVELPAAEREAALGMVGEEAAGGEGGGGGGGGGGAIADKEEPAPPDVSAAPPAEAMATVSSLNVGQIAGAVASVSAAVDNKVSEKKSDLAAEPPSMDRPSGAPETKDARGGAETEGEEGAAEGEVEEVTPEGESESAVEQLEELPDPGPSPTADVATPAVRGSEGGEMSDEDIGNIEEAIDNLPTTDPALAETAGPPPVVELAGEADPALADEQRTQLDETTANLETEGAADAAADMGENEIYPVVPEETLTATVGGGGGEGGGAAVEVDDATAAVVAEEKEGDAVRAEATAAQADMAQAETDQETEDAKARADHDQKVEQAVAENEAQQTAQRSSAKAEVEAKRGEWTTEQRAMVDQSRTDADTTMAETDATVEEEQTAADEKAAEEIEAGNEEAATAREDAERDAKAEKREAESESDGFFGWLASAATSFFNGVISAIGAVFEAARALVKAAIEAAQKAAAAIIDAARNAIIAAIRLAGDALMGLADVLLAGFPELRDRVKGAIQSTVAAAEDAVNELADSLKRGIQELLDALGKALDAALGLLEKGLKAAVEAVAAVVKGAIAAAKAAIDALATFAQLVRDVAANPGQWLANLGAAIIDGIQNHLWAALKSAVKEWFNAKLEAVLGIGAAIWEVLKKGAISVADVGKMAFTALKAAIPMMLIQLLVEKLVAMIVPAAGAVMAIVEGLQAAWGTVSQIIAAIGKFIAFLKAVKTGGAGPQFAAAVASAAVAVIEFVSNWLLAKLITPAKKVGGKVKAMAGRIMAKLKKIGQKIARAAKKVVGKIKKGLKKAGRKLGLGKKKGKKSRTKKDKENAQARLDKAMAKIVPAVESMSGNGVPRLFLSARLMYWRVRYRLTSLTLVGKGAAIQVQGSINPSAKKGSFWSPEPEWLRAQVHAVTESILKDDRVARAANKMNKAEGSEDDAIQVEGATGLPAVVRHHTRGKNKRGGIEEGDRRHYDMKGDDDVSTRVTEKAGDPPGPTNSRVLGTGRGSYRSFPARLARIAGQLGMSQKALLLAVQTAAQGGSLPPKVARVARPLAFLMFGREGIRNPESLVHGAMAMELVAENKLKAEQAFNKFPAVEENPDREPGQRARIKPGTGGGELPMSMAGAPAAARDLEAERVRKKKKEPLKKRSAAVNELVRREVALISKWLMAKLDREDLTWPVKQRSSAQAKIRKTIRTEIMKFFGLG
ncbi:MAG TPA: hypothetical protein VF618_07135 [Thermoanaerobaculia bacterium]